ncbi:MAG: LytTR family DNA-binding domain-containing protein [Solirubrobacterales bacterium]
MSEGLAVLAVDDERPALTDLVRILRKSAAVRKVDMAENGSVALRLLNAAEHPYDGVFLDVRMPDLSGTDLAKVLTRFATPPAVVFVTAYPDAAVEAFELRAVDYLVKPVSQKRLEQAITRIGELGGVRVHEDSTVGASGSNGEGDEGSADRDIVPVDGLGGTTRLVPRGSILYLQAAGDYVRVVTEEGRFLLRGTLSGIASRWGAFGFLQVHRQFVVNLGHVVEVRPRLNGTATLRLAGDHDVPVARREIGELRRRLGL